jgi:hypothetical protein
LSKDKKKSSNAGKAGKTATPGTTWQSALAILIVLGAAADAAWLLYAEWSHFGNPDMGSLVIAAAALSLALCAPYALFTRRPNEALAVALLGLACTLGAHALLYSGRLNYRAPCEAGQFECARTGFNRTMVRYPR